MRAPRRGAETEAFVRSIAFSLPPSDFGSFRAIDAMAAAIRVREQPLRTLLAACRDELSRAAAIMDDHGRADQAAHMRGVVGEIDVALGRSVPT